MDFDLSQYELQDTATIKLKNARGDDDLLGSDGKPVTVEIYGPGSDVGRKAQNKITRTTSLRAMRALRGEDVNDHAEQERDQVEKLVAITKGFSANFPATPRDVFSNQRLFFISRQIDEAFGKPGNFSKGLSAA